METLRGAMHGNALRRLAGRRILLVDDDPDALEGLRSLLEAWGYEVETAGDGMAALNQVPMVHPSVVITDVVMPRMTGLELLEAMRRELPSIPVIVMTAQGNLEVRRHAVANGAVAYLPKPVDTARLKSVLQSVLHDARGDDDR